MTTLDMPLAWAISERLCTARGVTLVRPGSGARDAVISALALAHSLGLGGWSADHARQYVTVTLPPLSSTLGALLSALPVVGIQLAMLCDGPTTIYLSPAACESPLALLSTLAHELGHADQIARGGLLWCASYGLVLEVRAGAEGACYGQDVAVTHALAGGDPHGLCEGALQRLGGYGLDASALALARGLLAVVERTLEHGGELGGPSHDVLTALRDAGVLS